MLHLENFGTFGNFNLGDLSTMMRLEEENDIFESSFSLLNLSNIFLLIVMGALTVCESGKV